LEVFELGICTDKDQRDFTKLEVKKGNGQNRLIQVQNGFEAKEAESLVEFWKQIDWKALQIRAGSMQR
jgi:hypothetical protein